MRACGNSSSKNVSRRGNVVAASLTGVVERAVLHGGGLSDFDVDKAAGGGAEVLVAVDT